MQLTMVELAERIDKLHAENEQLKVSIIALVHMHRYTFALLAQDIEPAQVYRDWDHIFETYLEDAKHGKIK